MNSLLDDYTKTLNKIRVGIVLVTFRWEPSSLIWSVKNSKNQLWWYVHHHGSSLNKAQNMINIFRTSCMRSKITLHMFNRGLAASWNLGIFDALNDSCDLILVMNDDISFEESGIDKFVDFSMASPCDVLFTYGKESNYRGIALENEIIRSQDFACFAIKSTAIEKIGYFDENFFPAYFEDTDYSIRMKMAGVTLGIMQDPIITHARGSSTKSDEDSFSSQMELFYAMNAKYLERKWGKNNANYTNPFNDESIGYNIPFESRRTPYGPWYDRELSVVDLLEGSGHDIVFVDHGLDETKADDRASPSRLDSYIKFIDNIDGELFCENYPTEIGKGQEFYLNIEFNFMPKHRLQLNSIDMAPILRGFDCIPIFLSYHWYDSFGLCAIYDGLRSHFNFSNLIAGKCNAHNILVLAPENSGTYELCITIVHEHVSWLESKGIKPFWAHAISVV